VLARQLFPRFDRYRAELPKVPVCATCNRAKQRVEDTVGVILQFGHDSEASLHVLLDRIPRTLRKNLRLRRGLQQGLREILIRYSSGIVVPAMVLHVDATQIRDIVHWFWWVIRGLHFHERRRPLSVDQTVYLIRPPSAEDLIPIRDTIAGFRHWNRSLAGDEFRYLFSASPESEVSMWLLGFKSLLVAGVVAGAVCSDDFHARMRSLQWFCPVA
jgi:hypothetical protein